MTVAKIQFSVAAILNIFGSKRNSFVVVYSLFFLQISIQFCVCVHDVLSDLGYTCLHPISGG